MTEDFSTEALHYLLDELDPERRAAFAEHLARDPVARAAFKTCADSLAHFACVTAPAEALLPGEQRKMLATLLATASAEATARRKQSQPARRWRLVWPLAAALLLGLNLWQYQRTPPAGPQAADDSASHRAPADDDERAGGPRSAAGAGAAKTATVAQPPTEAEIAEQLHRLDGLRHDYASIQRSRDALAAEYDRIIRLLAQRALVEQGVGRLAAMELVDSASFAKGERKGLINLARRFLTEPGLVALEPIKSQTGMVTPNPISTAVTGAVNFTGTASQSFVSAVSGQTATVTAIPTAPSAVAPSPQVSPPYAWSVFDETERQGYLNLYNLPKVPTDQSLQLWVKPVDSAEYQRVGEVPAQFYGGSGSLYYKLPETTATPAEIIVTEESRNSTPPTQPTGNVVLRGP